MRNGNPANEFLHVYCDSNGAPRFVKAKSPNVRKKNYVGVGHHHRQSQTQSGDRILSVELLMDQSRWAAIDFDAHDGDAQTAQRRSRSRHSKYCEGIRSFI